MDVSVILSMDVSVILSAVLLWMSLKFYL
jgi:hypothetical protein